MFIDNDDYLITADEYTRDIICRSDENKLRKAEKIAIEEISGYLRSRYDIAKAFTMQGDDRNEKLVQVTVDLSIYYLVKALPGSMSSEVYDALYSNALIWLKDIQAGRCSPDLPTYIDEETGETDIQNPIRYGGMKPNKYDY